jgi:hypothetical protein
MLQAKRRSMFYSCPLCGAWPHIATRGCEGCEGAQGTVTVLLSAEPAKTGPETWCEPGVESHALEGSSPSPPTS